jgi:hypothetical protein
MPKTDKQLAIFALMEEVDSNYNPIKEMVKLATTSIDDGIRLAANKELAQYCYAKRRPEDAEGKSGGDVMIQIIKYAPPEAIASPVKQIAPEQVIDVKPLTEEDVEKL